MWKLWFTLTRFYRKRLYIRGAIRKAEGKIWENEFLKHQLYEVRGGMREQYDWLRERIEGSIRRIAEIKYDIFYAETGDAVKVMDLPLPPREIEFLPSTPTAPHRFYRIEKKERDEKLLEELNRMITMREPDLEQYKQQLKGIDGKISEIDGAIDGLYELKSNLFSMLRKV